MSLIMYIEKKI